MDEELEVMLASRMAQMGKPGSDGKQGWAQGQKQAESEKRDAVGVSALQELVTPPS